MKKITYCIFLFLLLIRISYAGIGENFEPAGIQIAGDAIFSYYRFDIKENDYVLRVSIHPKIGIMVIRNLEVGFNLGYNFNYVHDNNFYEDPYYIVNGISFGTFLTYFFVKKPDSNKGIVHSIGINLRGSYSFFSDGDNTYGFSISPEYTMYFFLTKRIAPYLAFSPTFYFDNINVNGSKISLSIPLIFGISFHFPRKMRVTHKLKE